MYACVRVMDVACGCVCGRGRDRSAQPPPPPPKGARSVTTVLGDAAHPMGMFKGQGANTALAVSVLFGGRFD
jgi:hypothetical protein